MVLGNHLEQQREEKKEVKGKIKHIKKEIWSTLENNGYSHI